MLRFVSVLLFSLTLGAVAPAQMSCNAVFSATAIPAEGPSVEGRQFLHKLSPKNVIATLKQWQWTDIFFDEQAALENIADYQVDEDRLGKGFSAVVYKGKSPIDGAPVAIKVGKRPQDTAYFTTEAELSDRIARVDESGLFLRYRYDAQRNVLVSEFNTQFTSMDRWLDGEKSGLSPESVDVISLQLDQALLVLKKAGLVHSDLGLQNILIDPTTLQIKIIDFGIAATAGEYAPSLANATFNRRGGRFKGPNQKSNKPALFEDDAFAVGEIKKILHGRVSKIAFLGSRETPPARPEQITYHAPTTQEWLRLTTRTGTISDKGYPQRLHDSMRLVFEPYVDKLLAGETPDFQEMLRTQHRIVAAGVDGNNRYWGSSMGFWNYFFLNSAVPGKFRNEILYMGKYWFRYRLLISIQKTLGGDFSMNGSAKEPVQLANVPPELLPTRQMRDSNVYYIYPPVRGIPHFLRLMEKNLLTATSLMKSGRPPKEILPYLADYVQLGVSGHIFNLANYSIYMTQVNGLLKRLGYAGISPGNLDYHALVEDSTTFRRRFEAEVERTGP